MVIKVLFLLSFFIGAVLPFIDSTIARTWSEVLGKSKKLLPLNAAGMFAASFYLWFADRDDGVAFFGILQVALFLMVASLLLTFFGLLVGTLISRLSRNVNKGLRTNN